MSEDASSLRVHVNGADDDPTRAASLRRAVVHTLEAEGVGEAEVSLSLSGDEAMVELNRRYLDRDGPTDVLAFRLGDGDDALLGDLYVGLRRAEEQAREHGIHLEEELVRLAVHGTLHVLGWDHREGPDRAEGPMFRRQEELVRTLRKDTGRGVREGAP